MKKIFEKKYELYLFSAFWVYTLLLLIRYVPYGDDLKRLTEFETMSVIQVIKNSYYNWQPRYYSLAIGIFCTKYISFWKIFNSFCLTVSIFSIYKAVTKSICNESNKKVVLYCLFSGFFLIYPAVIYPSYIWLSGSTQYNPTFCTMIISSLPFIYVLRGNDTFLNKFNIVPMFLISLVCSYFEQTSVLLTGFIICSLVFACFRRIKVSKMTYVFALWITAHSIYFNYINLFSPRHDGEMHWIPEFPTLSVVDKIFQAVTYTNQYVMYNSGWLFFVCTVLLAFIIYHKYATWVRYIGFIPLLYSLMIVIPFESLLSLNNLPAYNVSINHIFRWGSYASSTVNDFNVAFTQLLPAMGSVFIVVLFGLLLLFAFQQLHEKVLVIIFYYGGFVVSYALGFTGAFFAIGGRGFYIVNMVVLLIFSSLVREALLFIPKAKLPRFVIPFYVFCSMFAVRLLFLGITNNVLWR